jgi:hypothetical protein
MRCANASRASQPPTSPTIYDIVSIYRSVCLPSLSASSRFLWLPIALLQTEPIFEFYVYSQLPRWLDFTPNEKWYTQEDLNL